MSGTAAIAERAACLLALLQDSESMSRVCRFRGGSCELVRAARYCLDDAIQHLLELQRGHADLVQGLRVGVLNFSGVPLLGGEGQSPLRPLAALASAARSVRPDALPRWLPNVEPINKEGSLELALAQAQRLLVAWLAESPGAQPPLLLVCGDGSDWSPAVDRLLRSLSLLTTPLGPLQLACALFRDEHDAGDAESDCQWLWERCSPLGGSGERAVAVNAQVGALIEQLLRQSGALEPLGAPPLGGGCTIARLMTHKRGNTDQECEDGVVVEEALGLAAVCDGASEGIFTRRWVQQLTESFAVERPNAVDSSALLSWLTYCRKAWYDAIGFSGLRGYQQNKVLDTGAGCTFLAWQLGAAESDGELNWRAWAVGDACLFWVRQDRLRATFPMVHADHFGLAPYLLRSRRDVPTPAPVFAVGRCRPGDQFFLATDAVAQQLLRVVGAGEEPMWSDFLKMTQDEWRTRIDELRDRREITNDDSTLLCVQVTGASATA